MLNIQLIRDNPDAVRRSIDLRRTPQPLDEFLKVDEEWRKAQKDLDDARGTLNVESKKVGATRDPEERQRLIEANRKISGAIATLEVAERQLRERRDALVLDFPNLPDADVPPGEDERDNVVVREVGEQRTYYFQPLPHWELGEKLGILDFERGVKLSGSRFYVLKDLGAMLERALIAWMLSLHRRQGYSELYLPFV